MTGTSTASRAVEVSQPVGTRRRPGLTKRLRTRAELAQLLGVPINTMYRSRLRGEGPVEFRIERHVRYRPAPVEASLAEHAS